jgi:hypothetical protein
MTNIFPVLVELDVHMTYGLALGAKSAIHLFDPFLIRKKTYPGPVVNSIIVGQILFDLIELPMW